MSDDIPDTLRYSKDHEWARLEADGSIVVGITRHAVDQLGDVTMVTLPNVGSSTSQNTRFGDIDSVKAVSELFAPVDGTVIAVNTQLDGTPELVNSDPYGEGWMIRIRPMDTVQYEALMHSGAYEALVQSES